MKKNNDPKQLAKLKATREKETNQDGYPLYPVSEDVYSLYRNRIGVDANDSQHTYIVSKAEPLNEKSFKDDVSGGDLDIPGSELDDDQEANGSEDEENNYYSLGADKED